MAPGVRDRDFGTSLRTGGLQLGGVGDQRENQLPTTALEASGGSAAGGGFSAVHHPGRSGVASAEAGDGEPRPCVLASTDLLRQPPCCHSRTG